MGIGAKQVSPGKPGGTQGREDRARQPSGSRLEVVTANPAHQYWQVILCHSCPPWSHNTAHHGFKCDRILSSAWRAVPGNEPPPVLLGCLGIAAGSQPAPRQLRDRKSAVQGQGREPRTGTI